MARKVIVTGATRGIGKAICEEFLRHDCQVIGIARKKTKVDWPIFECDLGNLLALEECFLAIINEHKTPEVLINNGGMYFGASASEETVEQYETTMNVNARSVFRLTQLFAEHLQKQKRQGSVVNVSSVSARIGSIDPAYAASKAAVDALTKSFARGFAASGIRVNAVAPGPVNTELAARIPEERKQQYMKSILQQRFGEPGEVAKVVYFLASDDASLMTGEILYATGGIL